MRLSRRKCWFDIGLGGTMITFDSIDYGGLGLLLFGVTRGGNLSAHARRDHRMLPGTN